MGSIHSIATQKENKMSALSPVTPQDRRRVIAALAIIIACPLYLLCDMKHMCMAGHMQHPPYPITDYIIDAVWIILFIVSGLIGWKSNLHFRRIILILLPLLIIVFIRTLPLFGLPLFLFLFILGIRNLFSGAKDWSEASLAEQQTHSKKSIRRWVIALVVIVGAVFFIWGGIKLYWFVRRVSSPHVQVSEVPFTRNFILNSGDSYIFELPNGKTVAVWYEKYSGILETFHDTDVTLKYGEKPFQELAHEKIPLGKGSYKAGELISYIRSDGTIQSGDEYEYVLYVDEYRIGLKKKGADDKRIPLTVSVRYATEKELVKKKDEVDFYLKRLGSADPDIQIDAMSELYWLLMLGSTYAKPRWEEITKAIRSLSLSANVKVKAKAIDVEEQLKQLKH